MTYDSENELTLEEFMNKLSQQKITMTIKTFDMRWKFLDTECLTSTIQNEGAWRLNMIQFSKNIKEYSGGDLKNMLNIPYENFRQMSDMMYGSNGFIKWYKSTQIEKYKLFHDTLVKIVEPNGKTYGGIDFSQDVNTIITDITRLWNTFKSEEPFPKFSLVDLSITESYDITYAGEKVVAFIDTLNSDRFIYSDECWTSTRSIPNKISLELVNNLKTFYGQIPYFLKEELQCIFFRLHLTDITSEYVVALSEDFQCWCTFLPIPYDPDTLKIVDGRTNPVNEIKNYYSQYITPWEVQEPYFYITHLEEWFESIGKTSSQERFFRTFGTQNYGHLTRNDFSSWFTSDIEQSIYNRNRIDQNESTQNSMMKIVSAPITKRYSETELTYTFKEWFNLNLFSYPDYFKKVSHGPEYTTYIYPFYSYILQEKRNGIVITLCELPLLTTQRYPLSDPDTVTEWTQTILLNALYKNKVLALPMVLYIDYNNFLFH